MTRRLIPTSLASLATVWLAAAPAAADEGSGAAAPEGLPTDASLDEPVTDSVTTVDTEGTPPPEAHEVDLPIDISGSVSFRSGLGQLAGRNEYATSESISSNYSLSVGYTVIEGLSVSSIAKRSAADDCTSWGFSGACAAGTRNSRSSWCCSYASCAAIRWPKWTGSKLPPRKPIFTS